MQHWKSLLPAYLLDIQREIEEHARGYGLDFWDVSFEVLDYKRMQEVAAYGGFPSRYPHWRFGMDFDRLSKSHVYGLSQIYEMVINNNPAYAYLLEGNSLVDQKMVIAHVLGHVDFFKNNYFFSRSNRHMIDEMANHATRVRRHIERLGLEKVETFIDSCSAWRISSIPCRPSSCATGASRLRPRQRRRRNCRACAPRATWSTSSIRPSFWKSSATSWMPSGQAAQDPARARAGRVAIPAGSCPAGTLGT